MPWSLISNDTKAQAAMQKAFDNAQMVTLSDWNHMTSDEIHDVAVTANIDPFCTDSILINGKGSVNCQDPAFIQSLVPPAILQLLGGGTLPFSNKGCAPLGRKFYNLMELTSMIWYLHRCGTSVPRLQHRVKFSRLTLEPDGLASTSSAPRQSLSLQVKSTIFSKNMILI